MGVARIYFAVDVESGIYGMSLGIIELYVRWWRSSHNAGIVELMSTKFLPVYHHASVAKVQPGTLHGGSEW